MLRRSLLLEDTHHLRSQVLRRDGRGLRSRLVLRIRAV